MKFNPYMIVSAEKAGLSAAENALRTETLRRQLESEELPPVAVQGRYNGSQEASFLVGAAEGSPEANAVERLAWHWQQDSVLYIDPDKRAYLVFPNGARRVLGPLKEISGDAEPLSYTQFPNGRRFAA